MILRKLVSRFVTRHTREFMSFYPDIIIVMQIFTRQNSTREFQRLIRMEAYGGMLSVLSLLKNEQAKIRHKGTLLFFILIDHISDLIF